MLPKSARSHLWLGRTYDEWLYLRILNINVTSELDLIELARIGEERVGMRALPREKAGSCALIGGFFGGKN